MADDISATISDEAERGTIIAITTQIATDRHRNIEGLADLLITPEQITEIMGGPDNEARVKQQQLEQRLKEEGEAFLSKMTENRQAGPKIPLDTKQVLISLDQLALILQATEANKAVSPTMRTEPSDAEAC